MGATWNGLSILESGGEFSIVATQNGQKLKLAPGMSYQLDAPATNGTNGQMGLFYGTEEDNQVTWNQADSSFINITNQSSLLLIPKKCSSIVNKLIKSRYKVSAPYTAILPALAVVPFME